MAIDDEPAERSGAGTGPPARALIAALVLGIAERCLGAGDNRDAQGMSRESRRLEVEKGKGQTAQEEG